MMQRRNAFTLIELLVVIAIIAILAAILFPVFAQARAKARQISCLSNIKQLDLGFMMYIQDYDETFPLWVYSQSWVNGNLSPNHYESFWTDAIFPYVKNAGVYTCPSANDRNSLQSSCIFGFAGTPASCPDVTKLGVPSALANSPMNYVGNQVLLEGDWNNLGAVSDASLKKPAQTLVVADGIATGLTGWAETWREPDPTNPTQEQHNWILSRVAFANLPANCWSDQANCGGIQADNYNFKPGQDKLAAWENSQTRHTQGENIAYADGHAKFLRARQITYDLLLGDQAN